MYFPPVDFFAQGLCHFIPRLPEGIEKIPHTVFQLALFFASLGLIESPIKHLNLLLEGLYRAFHGGKLTVHSELNKGTKFTMILPIS